MAEMTGPQLAVLWDRLSTVTAFRRTILQDLQAAALLGERTAKQNATTRLRRRTGYLARTLRGRVLARSRGLGVEITSPAPYARVQDTGSGGPGVGAEGPGSPIRSRRSGGWLAMPLGPVQTGAGVGRYASPLLDPADMFVWVSPAGNLFLASSTGGGLELRWRLLESVVIRGTRFLSDAIDAAGRDMSRRVAERVRGVLTGREA